MALCCAGLQAAVYQAQKNTPIRNVIVCTDYDEAGAEAYSRIKETLAGENRITVRREHSRYKDWNEDIRAQHGFTPSPGCGHPRMEYIRGLCRQMLDSGLPALPVPPAGAAAKAGGGSGGAETKRYSRDTGASLRTGGACSFLLPPEDAAARH